MLPWNSTLKNIRVPLQCYFKLCAWFHSNQSIQTGVTVRKHSNSANFLSHVTFKFNGWPWKTIEHFYYATSSLVYFFIPIRQFKLELQSGNPTFRSKSAISSFHSHGPFQPGVRVRYAKFGSKSAIFAPCDLEIWQMTLKNNRAPLQCCFKLCAWFHCHMHIQTEVRVRKQLSWVLTSVTLTFDLWPWPFARTSLLFMVITPENFMIRYDDGNTVKKVWRTEGQTDGQTDGLN